MPQDKRVSWTRHQVKSGDTLSSIANQYFTTDKLIRELNQLKSNKLKRGQYVLIPNTNNAPIAEKSKIPLITPDKLATTQTYKVLHIVQSGESFDVLEKKYNVSTEKIRLWNRLSSAEKLTKGKQLIIWRTMIKPGLYTVAIGDNLSLIAKKHKTTVDALKKLNAGLDPTRLKPGQRLTIG